jgi:hypothetical protein
MKYSDLWTHDMAESLTAWLEANSTPVGALLVLHARCWPRGRVPVLHYYAAACGMLVVTDNPLTMTVMVVNLSHSVCACAVVRVHENWGVYQ